MQSSVNRAWQFMPFDALKGFKEALRLVEKDYENKKILDEYLFDELNNTLSSLKIGDIVAVKYYYNFEYIETIGTVKKIDKLNKKIYFANVLASFDDIIYIQALKS